jgi:hypothetical protein
MKSTTLSIGTEFLEAGFMKYKCAVNNKERQNENGG